MISSVLFTAISEHLVRLNVVPALTALDEMHSVRSQYRLFMDHVLHTAMVTIDKVSVENIFYNTGYSFIDADVIDIYPDVSFSNDIITGGNSYFFKYKLLYH